ncbi:MAG TPA: hypothetical protein VK524_13985 [Polyangiaceae bacterium]|nr:hypothetical protein [Polyangiaceae bacterium]
MGAKRRGPGLAKTRRLELLQRRSVEFWQSVDYRWRELFEAADVMSEGATRHEPEGPVYYGSTSVLLTLVSQGGAVPDAQVDEVIAMIGGDPHARVRAVRVACLEAQLRAAGPLGKVRAELFVRRDRRGVRVDVEVEARVLADGQAAPGPRRAVPARPRRKSSGER